MTEPLDTTKLVNTPRMTYEELIANDMVDEALGLGDTDAKTES